MKYNFYKMNDHKNRKEIYEKIKQDCKFSHIFVKKCQSNQTGEKFAFFDVILENISVVNKIYDSHLANEYNKWNSLRGRSHELSSYVDYERFCIEKRYNVDYFIPGIKWAYKCYLDEHFYGKEIEFEGEKNVKAYQLDWFSEIFKSKQKYLTSFQKWINSYEDNINYTSIYNVELPKLNDRDKALYDSVRFNDKIDFIKHCIEIIKHPSIYDGDNYHDYINEAKKITRF